MIHRYVLHNNDIVEASEPRLRAGQIGLLSGWGVFSTLRITEGVLFEWDRHWARMARDASMMRVPLTQDPAVVHENLARLVDANGVSEGTLRIVAVRNGGGFWAGPGAEEKSDIIALTATSKSWGTGVKLDYVHNGRHAASEFAGTKILSWAMNLTWLEEAQSRGFDEVVLLNERGEVAECTSANIFVARHNKVLTPPLSSGCLPGVTRDVILNELQVPGLPVVEEVLGPQDLATADEVFITSTTRDLLPVLQLQDRVLTPRGEARVKLNAAFQDYLKKYIEAHRRKPVAPVS